jgi:hypothetical protein
MGASKKSEDQSFDCSSDVHKGLFEMSKTFNSGMLASISFGNSFKRLLERFNSCNLVILFNDGGRDRSRLFDKSNFISVVGSVLCNNFSSLHIHASPTFSQKRFLQIMCCDDDKSNDLDDDTSNADGIEEENGKVEKTWEKRFLFDAI